MLVEEAGEVGVHSLISRNKLIGESKAGHETAFLKPEDSAEGATEEDALNGSEGNKTLSIRIVRANPFDGPISLLGHNWNVRGRLEEEVLLSCIADICVD